MRSTRIDDHLLCARCLNDAIRLTNDLCDTCAGLTAGTRPCDNEREPDGELCTGTVTFELGDRQARCSVCGAWMGRLAPGHEQAVMPTRPLPPAVDR